MNPRIEHSPLSEVLVNFFQELADVSQPVKTQDATSGEQMSEALLPLIPGDKNLFSR
jgi:hypothetical protein